MIARSWNGHTDTASAPTYERYLATVVLAELRAIVGFRGMEVLRRGEGGGFAFSVRTLWDSMAAIKQFAGNSPDVAVVPPEAQALLLHYDAKVQHSVVVFSEA